MSEAVHVKGTVSSVKKTVHDSLLCPQHAPFNLKECAEDTDIVDLYSSILGQFVVVSYT